MWQLLWETFKQQLIAIVALVQPWATWVWKRFLVKGRVENYPAGFLEVGYSDFGPTVAIQGTLRVLNKDVFIKRMLLTVRKIKNNEQHYFQWVAFRTPKIMVGAAQELEIPSSFVVTLDQPHRYVIVFNDPQT